MARGGESNWYRDEGELVPVLQRGRAGGGLHGHSTIHESPNRGSYNYRGDWGVIDHVIVSQGLLDDAGIK